MATWRDRFRVEIAEVLAETRGQTPREVRQALLERWKALLMGECRYWPYRVWRSEVRRQMGLEKPKERGKKPVEAPADQLALF